MSYSSGTSLTLYMTEKFTPIEIVSESDNDGYGILIFRYINKKLENNGENGTVFFIDRADYNKDSNEKMGKLFKFMINKANRKK